MRWLRVCAYIGILLTLMFYLGATIANFVAATPRRGDTWFSHHLAPVEDWMIKLSVPISAVDLGIDIYILILPIVAVNELQLAQKRKIGVILIFMMGILY